MPGRYVNLEGAATSVRRLTRCRPRCGSGAGPAGTARRSASCLPELQPERHSSVALIVAVGGCRDTRAVRGVEPPTVEAEPLADLVDGVQDQVLDRVATNDGEEAVVVGALLGRELAASTHGALLCQSHAVGCSLTVGHRSESGPVMVTSSHSGGPQNRNPTSGWRCSMRSRILTHRAWAQSESGSRSVRLIPTPCEVGSRACVGHRGRGMPASRYADAWVPASRFMSTATWPSPRAVIPTASQPSAPSWLSATTEAD